MCGRLKKKQRCRWSDETKQNSVLFQTTLF